MPTSLRKDIGKEITGRFGVLCPTQTPPLPESTTVGLARLLSFKVWLPTDFSLSWRFLTSETCTFDSGSDS